MDLIYKTTTSFSLYIVKLFPISKQYIAIYIIFSVLLRYLLNNSKIRNKHQNNGGCNYEKTIFGYP